MHICVAKENKITSIIYQWKKRNLKGIEQWNLDKQHLRMYNRIGGEEFVSVLKNRVIF